MSAEWKNWIDYKEGNRMSGRKISLKDYTAAEREGIAELWNVLVLQAKSEDERARRVRIAHDWRHSTNGILRGSTETT